MRTAVINKSIVKTLEHFQQLKWSVVKPEKAATLQLRIELLTKDLKKLA